MVNTQNKQNTSLSPKEQPFALSVLAGSIGKAVIETYFNHFGYETYPFGYENHYANVTRFIKRDPLNNTITKIRAMPDLLVFDRDKQESYLVEIKATNNKNVSEYWMEKSRFESYQSHWPEVFLAIYMVFYGEIYCTRVSDIKTMKKGTLPNRSELGYYLDLKSFNDLPYYFPRMNYKKCDELNKEIQLVLQTFNSHLLQHQYPVSFDN